jgi:hypothetical protein
MTDGTTDMGKSSESCSIASKRPVS